MKAHKLLPLAEVLLAVVIAGGEKWVLFRGVFLLGWPCSIGRFHTMYMGSTNWIHCVFFFKRTSKLEGVRSGNGEVRGKMWAVNNHIIWHSNEDYYLKIINLKWNKIVTNNNKLSTVLSTFQGKMKENTKQGPHFEGCLERSLDVERRYCWANFHKRRTQDFQWKTYYVERRITFPIKVKCL